MRLMREAVMMMKPRDSGWRHDAFADAVHGGRSSPDSLTVHHAADAPLPAWFHPTHFLSGPTMKTVQLQRWV